MCGLLGGVPLAIALLPGITMEGGFSIAARMIPIALFLIVNRVISVWPENTRTAHPLMVLMPAVIGIVEDSLIWLPASWVAGLMDLALEIDGILPMVLGALIVRLTALALLALPSRVARAD
ncbi:hypothetical protein [Streptomyces albipurpureus]|uniref:Uncharacterized protein n=1 Tax=Streptomyces albipurpureus TaxID=2897419 RepID=A0ABT0UQI2_9ACTN|nr:hypothetical protein [Streptomyces sp. CWNU-1]MCM2390783.1 hypothetical protein [Streptomyces sp. CWNU-1]